MTPYSSSPVNYHLQRSRTMDTGIAKKKLPALFQLITGRIDPARCLTCKLTELQACRVVWCQPETLLRVCMWSAVVVVWCRGCPVNDYDYLPEFDRRWAIVVLVPGGPKRL